MRRALAPLVFLAACAGGGSSTPAAPAPTATILTLTFASLPALDPVRDGSYAAWVTDGAQHVYAAGTFVAAPSVSLALPQPIRDGAAIMITVHRPTDDATQPSSQILLSGAIRGGHADLGIAGAVTQAGLPLVASPGQFTIFTPSNNGAEGYPSEEEAGIWLFNMAPLQTPQRDMWVRLTQLRSGWVYEEWVVRDINAPAAVWLSLGKFVPDATGAVNGRDDDGWGPFSGVLDYATETSEDFPGSDFISNPLHLPVPGNLTLPLNLLETVAGVGRWTHVITIEPAWKRGEPMGAQRPFILRPYSDPVGASGPGVPRTITLHADGVVRGSAELR